MLNCVSALVHNKYYLVNFYIGFGFVFSKLLKGRTKLVACWESNFFFNSFISNQNYSIL
jgi:hypothetical protein